MSECPNIRATALIAIGRNEGDRLRACLASAKRQQVKLVYVDSGSTDGSVAMARELGAEVVELKDVKFTAALARNAGAKHALATWPELKYLQFVDGDCELVDGWIEAALIFLDHHPKAAIVAGRRRERFPEASVYNRLADMEWNTPVGQVRSVGGDALMRVLAFTEVGGYDERVIAGEEPEMCVRLRKAGHEVWRLDTEMTLHDAAMTRLGQWWKRNVRAGHAYAQGYAMHGSAPELHNAKQTRSNYAWSLLVPLWPVLWWKVYRGKKSMAYASFTTLGKWPQTLGQLKYKWNTIRGRGTKLIEYK